jgi:hypothetical protein
MNEYQIGPSGNRFAGFKILGDGLKAVRGRPLFSASTSEFLDSWGWLIWGIPLLIWG